MLSYMSHHRQMIINMSVKDDTPEEKLEEIRSRVDKVVKDCVDPKCITDIEVKLN